MNFTKQMRALYDQGHKKFRVLFFDHKPRTINIGKSRDGTLILMKTRTRGYPITEYNPEHDYLLDYFKYTGPIKDIKPVVKTDPAIKWVKDCARAIKLLEASGLWEALLENFKIAQRVGYQGVNEAYKLYNTKFVEDYDENKKIQLKRLEILDKDLVTRDDDGIKHANTDILWHMTGPIKIKKMNFGSQQINQDSLRRIKEAMANKTDISIRGYRNYDISLEYRAEDKRAWYSEEFKNCGNGHYYLALDHEFAWYYEDD